MDEMWKKRSSHVPAFGDWEKLNEMPITQYFESARQAGLLRYASSSGECDAPLPVPAVDSEKLRTSHLPPPNPMRGRPRGKRYCQNQNEHLKEATRKRQGRGRGGGGGGGRKVFDVTVRERQQFPNKRHPTVGAAVSSTKQQGEEKNDGVSGLGGAGCEAQISRRAPKAVDEDLYKIPPHLLPSSHRKKRLGFLTRCLVLPCAV